MIKVSFIAKNDKLHGFEISGHSGMDERGRDVLCASVSSAAYMVANTLTEVAGIDCDVKLDDGYFKLVVLKQNEQTELLLKGFRLHLSALSEQYSKYLLCKVKTVKE